MNPEESYAPFDDNQQAEYNFDVDGFNHSNELLSEYSPFVDEGTIEYVEGFELNHSNWHTEIPQEELELPQKVSIRYGTPEDQCGEEDRVQIKNTSSLPWKFICRLFVTQRDGRRSTASGFFIGKRCIITSGHVVNDGPGLGWAKKIIVTPGQSGRSAPFGRQASYQFASVKGWVQKQLPDYDYGAIFLPDDTLYNRVRGHFGYKIIHSNQVLNNAGYAGDKADGTLWFNAGDISKFSERRIFYMLDTAGGHSGSPIFINQHGKRIVVGIHGYGGCPNSAIRVTSQVATNLNRWKNH